MTQIQLPLSTPSVSSDGNGGRAVGLASSDSAAALWQAWRRRRRGEDSSNGGLSGLLAAWLRRGAVAGMEEEEGEWLRP